MKKKNQAVTLSLIGYFWVFLLILVSYAHLFVLWYLCILPEK